MSVFAFHFHKMHSAIFRFQDGCVMIHYIKNKFHEMAHKLACTPYSDTLKNITDSNIKELELVTVFCSLEMEETLKVAVFTMISGFIGAMIRRYDNTPATFNSSPKCKKALINFGKCLEKEAKKIILADLDHKYPIGNIMRLKFILINDPNFAAFDERNVHKETYIKFVEMVDERKKKNLPVFYEPQKLLNDYVCGHSGLPWWMHF
jgi:hypothetical protein